MSINLPWKLICQSMSYLYQTGLVEYTCRLQLCSLHVQLKQSPCIGEVVANLLIIAYNNPNIVETAGCSKRTDIVAFGLGSGRYSRFRGLLLVICQLSFHSSLDPLVCCIKIHNECLLQKRVTTGTFFSLFIQYSSTKF